MPSRIKLESIGGDDPVVITELESGSITLGREPENAIVVDSVSVSRRHGCVAEAGSQWIFRDLGSTNGSWVNGIRAEIGQVRLLRNGDVVQLADFPMRVVEVDPIGAGEEMPASLLIFFGDKFESEFPFITPDAAFVAGGAEAHLYLEGAPDDESPLSVQRGAGGGLEATIAGSSHPVIVNGLAAGGAIALNDKDEISVANYRIIINDPASAAPEFQYEGDSEPVPEAYNRPNLPEHLRGDDGAGGWESESARRRTSEGRKFIFGANDDDVFDPTSTLALPARDPRAQERFEPTASQRFAGVGGAQRQSGGAPVNERMLIVVGMIVFVVILAFAGYLFFG